MLAQRKRQCEATEGNEDHWKHKSKR